MLKFEEKGIRYGKSMVEPKPAVTEDIEEFNPRALWGMGRGTQAEPKATISLAAMFANRVCGRSVRDVKMLVVGEQGSGKSRSMLALACRCAEEIAARKGGTPEYYFPPDLSHCIIGDPSGHADMLKHMKEYGIYILDDAGVSLNARNFMTNFNKSLNDIFQTMRTDRCILLVSAPDSFLIDKVPRTIFSHYCEMAESDHARGVNYGKVFKINRMFRENATHYRYINVGHRQLIRHRFGNPPQIIIDTYEALRSQATQDIKAQAGGKQKEIPVKVQRPERTCTCGYTWTPKVDNPKRCPECYTFLNRGGKVPAAATSSLLPNTSTGMESI